MIHLAEHQNVYSCIHRIRYSSGHCLRYCYVLVPEGDWFKFHLGHLTDVERGCRQSLPAHSKVLP
jgi:hypothetical protein